MRIIIEPEEDESGKRIQLDEVIQYSLVGTNVVSQSILKGRVVNKGQLLGLLLWAAYDIIMLPPEKAHGTDSPT